MAPIARSTTGQAFTALAPSTTADEAGAGLNRRYLRLTVAPAPQ